MPSSLERTEGTLAWITGILFVLSVVALVLRVVAGDPSPSASKTNSPYISLAETLVGEGNVRIGDTGTGDIVVLLNSDRQTAETASDAKQITAIIQSMAPGRAVSVTEANFTPRSIGAAGFLFFAECLTLFAISVLSGLLFVAVQRRRLVAPVADPVPANDVISRPHTPPTTLAKAASSLDKAAEFAEHQPARTAEIITGWLRDEDNR
ncbi:MAG: hypothetical protein AAF292_00695 [Pseudomonadota bacterium]